MGFYIYKSTLISPGSTNQPLLDVRRQQLNMLGRSHQKRAYLRLYQLTRRQYQLNSLTKQSPDSP